MIIKVLFKFQMGKNLVFHNKTKHIDVQYHFVRNLVQQGVLEIMYCDTKEQDANIFTKALPKHKFYKFKDDLGISPDDHYGGEMFFFHDDWEIYIRKKGAVEARKVYIQKSPEEQQHFDAHRYFLSYLPLDIPCLLQEIIHYKT